MGSYHEVEAKINDGDTFWYRRKGDQRRETASAVHVLRVIAESRELGIQVDVKEGPGGRYILLHSGTGSGYGHYFWETGN